ncbi:MAG: hypothetical protein C4K47_04360 [Candidatus Thorarchaeota archaeon]|nr:MAG: hypothetical protein C4K47_04360 [Candidatus Thorarchaeota archaeon]
MFITHLISGVSVEREAFVCPFRGAPHGYELEPGTIQARCRYCGSTILVPSELGGLYQQCPNHPGVPSIGLCNRCGKAFCEQCLYVVRWEDDSLGQSRMTSRYFCPACMEQWKSALLSDLMFTFPCGFVLTVVGLVLLLIGFGTMQFAIAVLGVISIPFGALCCAGRNRIKSHPLRLPPTVQEKRRELKEILGVTRTVCPHCKAAYLYRSDQIRPDRTVVCQNCNQTIRLEPA